MLSRNVFQVVRGNCLFFVYFLADRSDLLWNGSLYTGLFALALALALFLSCWCLETSGSRSTLQSNVCLYMFFLADQISCRSYVDSVYSMPSLADSLSYLLFICSFGRRRSNFSHQNERYLTFACYVFRTMFTSLPMQNLPRSCGVI